MRIRLKRHSDGSASLTCTRDDGTVTWQRQTGGYALVFPAHDLTHYAVETTLEFSRGFYGLLAEGWEITDFAPPWPRGEIPAEAVVVELIVGLLDSERRRSGGLGDEPSAESFHAEAELYIAARRAAGKQVPDLSRRLTDDELRAVRARRTELLDQWAAVPPGGALELDFET